MKTTMVMHIVPVCVVKMPKTKCNKRRVTLWNTLHLQYVCVKSFHKSTVIIRRSDVFIFTKGLVCKKVKHFPKIKLRRANEHAIKEMQPRPLGV